jgi:hypothetical protein
MSRVSKRIRNKLRYFFFVSSVELFGTMTYIRLHFSFSFSCSYLVIIVEICIESFF